MKGVFEVAPSLVAVVVEVVVLMAEAGVEVLEIEVGVVRMEEVVVASQVAEAQQVN